MPPCICREALRHSFTSARDVVMGNEYDAILAASEQLARYEAKWMSLYRCRTCGMLWTEGCYDYGQVYFYYLQLRSHYIRERSARLRADKLRAFRKTNGCLYCEICGEREKQNDIQQPTQKRCLKFIIVLHSLPRQLRSGRH